jgi:hypothetical protein
VGMKWGATAKTIQKKSRRKKNKENKITLNIIYLLFV